MFAAASAAVIFGTTMIARPATSRLPRVPPPPPSPPSTPLPPSSAVGTLILPRAGQAFLDSLVQLHLLDGQAIPGFLQQYQDRLAEFADPGLLGEALVQMGV